MRILKKCYEKVLTWSRHPKAPYYLALVSFIDSSFFPISPNVMIIPMMYAMPSRAFRFAFITIVSSLAGGLVGYAFGYFAFESMVHPFLNWMGYMDKYQACLQWFQQWGFWAIIIGCLTPFIPYKFFTIGAGVLQLPLGGFFLASSIGRSLRFLLIAIIVRWGGPKLEPFLKRSFERLNGEKI